MSSHGPFSGGQFNTGYGQSATHSFTVGANDQGSSNGSAQLQIDFDDPSSSAFGLPDVRTRQ